jgi:hypothetical protein
MTTSRPPALWVATAFFVVLLSLGAWLGAEGAPDVLDRLKPGEWYELPNSRLRSVLRHLRPWARPRPS